MCEKPKTITPSEDQKTTSEELARWPEFEETCGKLIRLARQLRPRMVAGDLSAAGEFGQAAGTEFGRIGTTVGEAEHYSRRILAMVLAEPQA